MRLPICVIAAILANGCMLGIEAQAAPASRLEYAKQCAAEMGSIPTGFNCLDGTVIPITKNNIPQNQPIEDCDKPIQLGGPDTPCVPFARLLRLNTGVSSVETVVVCRKYHASSNLKEKDPIFHDIAMIQHNKLTGNTCYYQSPPHEPRDGSHVPSPQEDSPAAKNMWLEPGSTGPNNIKCTNCHDADPFIWSQYVAQVADISKWNPKGLWNSNFLGAFGSPMQTFDPNANACTSCHRVGSNTCNPGAAIGIHEYADNRWMPLGIPFGSEHEKALLQLDKCCNNPALSECNTKLASSAPDQDLDEITNKADNCPKVANPDQRDVDNDGHGDLCDNCKFVANSDQLDTDEDNQGNVCDDDDDNDGCKDNEDQHPVDANPVIATKLPIPNTCQGESVRGFEGDDTDKDGLLNCKDDDDDNDTILDGKDACPTVNIDSNNPLLLVGCGFGITSCPLIYNFPLGVCFGTTCIEDFRAKLDWVVNVINPPIEVATFDRFWIEAGNLYISKGSLNGNRNPLQAIVKQLSIAPDSAPAGWFRLSIWSRNTSYLVAEYTPSQITFSGSNFTGSSIRLSPPQSPGGKILIEASNKTEPVKTNNKIENDYSTYLWVILILAVVAALTVIAIRKS